MLAAKKTSTIDNKKYKTSDFVPFACHYSPDTILTKDQQLVQTIRMDFDAGLDDDEFRQELRDAINSAIDPSKHAVWTHTMRNWQKEQSGENVNFGDSIKYQWRQQLPRKLHLDNSIYISILHDSPKSLKFDVGEYLRLLSFSAEGKYQKRELDKNLQNLGITVHKIMEKLEKFNARKLTIYEENGVTYSEPMEFIHRILTFRDRKISVSNADFSKYLLPEKLLFNSFRGLVEVRHLDGTSEVGAVITLKECDRLPAVALDYLLNVDFELVVSQSLDFGSGNIGLQHYEYQKYIANLNSDKEFGRLSGLDKLTSVKPDDFALQQTNIVLFQPNRDELKKKLEEIYEELAKLGIVAIVEDLRVERSFWAMLPGNFSFLKRQDIVANKDIMNFSLLANDLYQQVKGSLFGDPVMFFKTYEGQPFPFHFIDNGTSHVLAVSEFEEQRNALLNMIMLNAAQFYPRMIYVDMFGKYQQAARAVGADYMQELDFDALRHVIAEEKHTVIIINDISRIVDGGGEEFFNNFLEYAGEHKAIVMCGMGSEQDAIPVIQNFDTQFYFGIKNIKKNSDKFDLFEDEIKIIQMLGEKGLYLKHNYEEMMLSYEMDEKFFESLINGELS